MNYYAIQVLTRQEKKFLALARNALSRLENEGVAAEGELLWPRRKLKIRKRAKIREEETPIFPGYLFWQAETIIPEVYWTIKRTGGFIRFLKSNQDIEPLSGPSKRLLLHFLGYGEIVGSSNVVFNDGDRITVMDGPMKGLEGKIKKVDKRKGRAKIELMMYEESFLIDFGFDIINKVTDTNNG